MKGLVFLKPLEFIIIADGEKWRQGDQIKGSFQIKNLGADKVDLSFLKISLAVGIFKKIKLKDKKSWNLISDLVLSESISIEPNKELIFPWKFLIPEDCQITEKDKSVFLTFNTSNSEIETWPSGELEIAIEPKLIIHQFLEVIQNFLRFKIVKTKFSDGMVEVKLNPPNSKEMSHVESVVLRAREVNSILELEYTFNILVFETVAGNIMAQKKIKHVEQKLTSKECYIYGDSFNQDFVISSVGSLIKEATPKFYS